MIQASFRIVAPPAKREEILEALLCLQGPAEVARGCRGCRVLQDSQNLNVLVCLEQWDTRDDLEEHLRCERFRRLLPYFEMSTEPPEFSVFAIDPLGGIELLIAAVCPEPG